MKIGLLFSLVFLFSSVCYAGPYSTYDLGCYEFRGEPDYSPYTSSPLVPGSEAYKKYIKDTKEKEVKMRNKAIAHWKSIGCWDYKKQEYKFNPKAFK